MLHILAMTLPIFCYSFIRLAKKQKMWKDFTGSSEMENEDFMWILVRVCLCVAFVRSVGGKHKPVTDAPNITIKLTGNEGNNDESNVRKLKFYFNSWNGNC